MGYQVVGVLGVPRILLPKGECRYIVYTAGPKGFPCDYFRVQVYTTELHEPFGNAACSSVGFRDAGLSLCMLYRDQGLDPNSVGA